MITLTLPYPPSANRIWRNVIHRGKPRTLLSAEGRQYRGAVGQHCLMQKVAGKRLSGRLRVVVYMHSPDNRRRDVSNILKALEDAITHAGVWRDDSQIDDVRVVRMGVVPKGAKVEVEIEELQPV